MTADAAARLIPLPATPTVAASAPEVHAQAWVAPGAVLVGDVRLGAQASVWYNAVVRGDGAAITIGERSNLQDLVACHVDTGFPLTLGDGVSVGHGAVLHGCTIGDDVLVGMHATVLNGATVGAGSLIAAGALVAEGADIPPRSLVVGVPGRVVRTLDDAAVERLRENARTYLVLIERHRGA